MKILLRRLKKQNRDFGKDYLEEINSSMNKSITYLRIEKTYNIKKSLQIIWRDFFNILLIHSIVRVQSTLIFDIIWI